MKPKRGAKKGAVFWGAEGWKAVDVGDNLLLGAEEFGFMGLEVLDPKAAGAGPAGAAAATPPQLFPGGGTSICPILPSTWQ